MTAEHQLERSVLERKERDELQQIARALGAEPPSRARKADLVALILEKAGVTGGNGGGGDASDDGQPAAEDAPDGSDRAATPPQDEAQQDEAQQDEGQQDEGQQDGGQQDKVQRGKAQQGKAQQGKGQQDKGGEGDKGERGKDRQDNGQQDKGGEDDKAQPGKDRQDADGGADDQQARDQGDQGDQGNRRRRRRGRDRDRDRPEEPFQGEPVECAGHLDLRDEGYGFLRTQGYLPTRDDVYVSVKQVRQFGLRKGDHLTGASRPAGRSEKNPALLRIDAVNGQDPDEARRRPRFEDLTPLFPDERLRLEVPTDPSNMTARIVDLIAPIGKGQRGLIVSPPKAGKTTIMKQIARSIETNNPEVKLMVLLVDERPEEVTDMRRWVQGEVVASTFDRPSEEHTQVAELTIERAKRLVELGEDVVIILDGITRLARAYNLAAPATGRIMSGGVDSGALYPPKKFFGAARNVEEGGSLTILATALVETGSKMDEVIFEEFKGTGNMELRLDRRMAERRVYPAIDVDASSTRHEELLFDRKQLQQVWKLRRVLSGLGEGGGAAAGLEMLIDRLKTFKTNDEFLTEVAKAAPGG